jgi:hypothetical protein
MSEEKKEEEAEDEEEEEELGRLRCDDNEPEVF